jgi:thiol-disulfide isomerase/thioredoxin
MRRVILVVVAFLFASCVQEGLKVGSTAPTSNEEIAKALSQNKVVILQFHADWCAQCRQQLPIVEELAEDYEDVILVEVDFDKEKRAVADYGVISIPRTIIIDKNGKIAAILVGVTGRKNLEKKIKALL